MRHRWWRQVGAQWHRGQQPRVRRSRASKPGATRGQGPWQPSLVHTFDEHFDNRAVDSRQRGASCPRPLQPCDEFGIRCGGVARAERADATSAVRGVKATSGQLATLRGVNKPGNKRSAGVLRNTIAVFICVLRFLRFGCYYAVVYVPVRCRIRQFVDAGWRRIGSMDKRASRLPARRPLWVLLLACWCCVLLGWSRELRYLSCLSCLLVCECVAVQHGRRRGLGTVG